MKSLKTVLAVTLFALIAAPVAAQLVPEALYYKFNEGSGTTITNSALPGAGSPTPAVSGHTWVTPGQVGPSALNFAGTTTPSFPVGWAPDLGTGNWTVEFWLRTSATAIGYIGGATGTTSWRIFVQGAAGTGVRMTGPFTVDIPNVVDGQWHHVAWVYNSAAGTVTGYRDGVQAAQVGSLSLTMNDSTWTLGNYNSTAGSYLGDLDEFRFWRQARSQGEIQTWMNIEAGVTGDAVVLSNQAGSQSLITGSITDEVFLDLSASAFNTSQTINSLTFTKAGTVPNASVGTIKLIHDVNTNGQVDVTDPILGQGTLTGGTITFNSGAGFPIAVPTSGGPRLLLAVSSAANWLVGENIEFSIASSTDITWSGTATDFTNFPVSSGLRDITPPVISVGGQTLSSVLPFNGVYYRKLNIFTPADLASIPAGSVITEIQLYGATALLNPVSFTGFEMRLSHSNTNPATTLSTNWNDHFADAQVAVISAAKYTPEILGAAAPFQMVFKFDRPFVYNGTQAICMDMEWRSRENPGWANYYDSSRSGLYTATLGAPTGLSTTTNGNIRADIFFEPAPAANLAWIANRHVPANVFDGGAITNKVMLNLEAATLGAAQNLGALTFNKTGTVPDVAIFDVRLVRDTNGNGEVDTGEPVLGFGTLSGGSVTFPIIPALNVAPGTPERLLLAFSTTSALTLGDTIGFEIASTAGASWSGGQDVSAYPVAASSIVSSTLRIGGPLGTTSNTIPFNLTTYRHLTVYAADELKDFPTGTLINDFRVFGTTATTRTFTNFELRIAHSTTDPYGGMTATFDANWVGSQTTVISSASFTPTAVGTFGANTLWSFPFSTPFVYNGVDGLAVEVVWTTSTGTGFSIQYSAGRQRVYTTVTTALTGTLSQGTGSFGVEFGGDSNPNGVAVANASTGDGLTGTLSDHVVMDLTALAFGASRDISSITLTKIAASSISDASFSNIKLVRDMDNNGVVDVTDPVLGSGTLSGGAITFNFPPVTVSGSVRLLVAATSAATLPPGGTFGLEISSASAITWSGTPTDFSTYPISSGIMTVRLSGTYTINQTSGDFTDIGDAFDALELAGVAGPVILEITDSATYVSTPSYTLGATNTGTALALVPGASATNSITLRAAPGQNPKVQGNANGAVLIGASSATALTGRGGIAITQSWVTIEGLEVFGGPNFGILGRANNLGVFVFLPTDIVIRRCIVRDIPDGPGIGFFGQNAAYFQNGVIENCMVWNCFTNSVPAIGAIEGITSTMGCIAVRNPHAGTTTLRHNTVLNTSTLPNVACFAFSAASTATAVHSLNNNIGICSSTTNPAIFFQSVTFLPTAANTDFNYWHATVMSNQATVNTFTLWQGAGSNRDPNGSDADPLVISETGTIDLHLQAGSPCIDPVGQTSTVAIDIDGDIRPAGLADIGADERPVMEVLQGTTVIRSGGTFDAGVFSTGPNNVTFAVRNNSLGALSLTGTPRVAITLNGNLDPTTVVQTQPAVSVAPSGTSNFVVTVDPTAGGAFSFTLSIDNSSAGQSPYTFTVTGIVGPDLDLQRPAGTTIVNNGTHSLAPTVYQFGISHPLTFTISNQNGGQTLNITSTNATAGTNITTATAGAPVSSTVTVGNTTTFGVNFTPTAAGPFSFTVSVVSNDPLDSNYNITVTGTANTSPVITVTRTGFGPVSNAGVVNVLYNTPLSAQNLNIQVTDTNAQNTSVAVTISNTTTQGFVLSEWNSASGPVPITRTPSSGSFNVPSTTHLVTITADDGMNPSVFTFTFDIGANTAPTIDLATGSGFAGSAVAGYSATVNPATLPGNLTLNLFDVDNNLINVTAVNVAPGAPAGITAPGTSVGNASGTTLTFGGDATLTVTGTYTWTLTITDGVAAPVNVDVSITVINFAPVHVSGSGAQGGDGSAATPYQTQIGLGGTAVLEMATVTDANTTQTLSEVSVVGNAANPSSIFDVSFNGTGAAGTVDVVATHTATVADVGEHTFTVTVTDGFVNVAIVVRIVVDTTGNTAPIISAAGGSSFTGTQVAGFTMSVNPGTALATANITVQDSVDNDDIEVISVVAQSGVPDGVTPPTAASATAGPITLTWGGTMLAVNAPGTYGWVITIGDGITMPVSFTASITLANMAPEHALPPAPTTIVGNGTAATPYEGLTEVGKAGPIQLAVVTDQNTGQALSISGTPVAGVGTPSPTSGASGFTFALTDGNLYAIPNSVLKNADTGVHRYTVTITDGIATTNIEVAVKVVRPQADAAESDGCTSGNSKGGWLLVMLALAGLAGLAAARRRLA